VAGACGSCTFCCKVPEVVEVAKPRGQWCAQCDKGKGCKVYAERPQSCADFACFWLISQSYPGGGMPERLRPDKAKVMLAGGAQNQLIVDVDPGYPGAWRRPEIMDLIKRWQNANPTPVVIAIDRQRIGLSGATEHRWTE
jgi:hypothetical protein